MLPGLDLDLKFLRGVINCGAEREIRADFDVYNKMYWQTIMPYKEEERWLIFLYPFYLADHAKTDGIKVLFYKDVIRITGLFDHFQSWARFASTKELREGYGKLANEIIGHFGSPCAIYASEWCIMDDECEYSFTDLQNSCMAKADRQAAKLDGIESYEFFIESLQDEK